MKLIQLNTWWGGKLTSQISDFIKEERADILCLQEVMNIRSEYAGLFLPLQAMQNLGELTFSAFAPLFTYNYMQQKASAGNAILSKLPILETNTFYTNLEHVDDFDFSKHDYNVRNFLHCLVETKSGPVHVITHHGHHVPSHKNGNDETMRQMKQIKEYIDTLEGPIILTGDFNLAPHSESLEVLNNTLQNLSIKHRLLTTRNLMTSKKEVCDYIFVNEQIKIAGFSASEKVISDHKALILEFDL